MYHVLSVVGRPPGEGAPVISAVWWLLAVLCVLLVIPAVVYIIVARRRAGMVPHPEGTALTREEFLLAIKDLFRALDYDIDETGLAIVARCQSFAMATQEGRIAVVVADDADSRMDVAVVNKARSSASDMGFPCIYAISTNGFSPDAHAFARQHRNHVHLMGAAELADLAKRCLATDPGRIPSGSPLTRLLPRETKVPSAPPCPKCGVAMILKRPGRKRPYWRCSVYPFCAGRRSLSPHDRQILARHKDV